MGIDIHNPLIPENKKGKALDMEEEVAENSMEEALNTYNRACTRLLNPPLWRELAGALSASFKIKDNSNADPHRLLAVGDYIQIDIPGPGPSGGDGYDWVFAEAIQENIEPHADDSFGIRLRSASSPGNEKSETAHFFDADATSSFLIKRCGTTVSASYHGRNEVPNTADVQLVDKVRNALVAGAALVGVSEMQWKALLKGLLQKEIGG